MQTLLAIVASLAIAHHAHAEQERTACVVSLVRAEGGGVSAHGFLGVEPIPTFIRTDSPAVGRWCLGDGDLASLEWSRAGDELFLSAPRGGGPVAFWVRDRGSVPHERILVTAWDTEAASSRVRAEVSTATISGRVQSNDGHAVRGVTVSVIPLSSDGCESWASTVTDADGRFHLYGLLSGRYQVVLDAEYAFTPLDGSPSLQFPRLPRRPAGLLVLQMPDLPLELATCDVQLQPFVVEPCTSSLRVDVRALMATGEVEIARAAETPHWFPRMLKDDVLWMENNTLKFAETARGGWVDFVGLPAGSYRVHVWRTSDVVASYRVELEGGTRLLTLGAVDSDDTGAVEGQVEDWDHLPFRELTLNRSTPADSTWGVLFQVFLTPASEADGVQVSARVKLDAEGRFAIEDLPPGEYRTMGLFQIVALGPEVEAIESEPARAHLARTLRELGFPEGRFEVKRGVRTQVGIRFE